MPLFATDDNPLPPGAVEHALTAADGMRLRAARWNPEGVRGTVVLLGGRAEYIEKYFETVTHLIERGWAVATMDWRGQGGSARPLRNPLKGHVDDFADYERDFEVFQYEVLTPHAPKPWIGVCHSMGGAIMLRIAHAGRCPFDRLVLSAPMIALHSGALPPWLQTHARPDRLRAVVGALDALGLGGAFAPGGGSTPFSLQPFEGNPLTSDPARYARMQGSLRAHPELGLGAPTIGWTYAAMRQMRDFEDPAYPLGVAIPTLTVACGADTIVDTRAIERFATRMKCGELIVVDGARHEIMVERDRFRDLFLAAFDEFAAGAAGDRDLFTSPYRAPV